jgi:hypothetical protein
MTVVAITMVRDEADIVAATVGHMITQVDHVVVADNRSTDGTREILDWLDVTVVDDPEVGYYQAQKMTRLAHMARTEFGADWVVPFDADEWWTSPHGRIGDILDRLEGWPVAEAALFDHVATGVDPDELDPTKRIRWRRTNAAPLPKVACRTADDLSIHQGNHGASYSAPHVQIPGYLEVRHFPYRSPEQFARKALNGAEAYAATDLPDDVGRHWREYGRLAETHGVEALHDVFRRWFWCPDPHLEESLAEDPVR